MESEQIQFYCDFKIQFIQSVAPIEVWFHFAIFNILKVRPYQYFVPIFLLINISVTI